MTVTPETIMVEFAGEGAGEGELSWGQQENWATITASHDWVPLGGATALPEGMTIEQIVDTLRYAMSRNPSLRTRLRLGGERPVQIVHASGQLPLEVVEAGDADPAEVAEALSERYRAEPLDFTAQWPLRTTAILRHGRPTHMVALISHLAADATGLSVMMREMIAQVDTPVDGLPPLAQAQWQQSPAGRRHSAAALRYWEEVYRTIDPDRFPKPSEIDPSRPRYWHGEYDSPALLSAVRTIAAASGLGTSMVFMALLAAALHEINGVNPVVIRPIVSNRFRPGLADVVCTVAQAGICVLDVAGAPFDEALRRVQRAVMKAYKYSYFDHAQMIAIRARVEQERGVTFDTGLFINDRFDVSATASTERDATMPPSPDVVSPPPSSFRWVAGQDDRPYEPLFVAIDNVSGAVRVSMHLDSHFISLADAEAFVRAMDVIATAAADR